MSLLRLVRSVDAIPVELPRADIGQIAVPHLVRALRQPDLRGLRGVILVREQAQLHAARVLGEEREVDAGPVPRGSQWIGTARPDAQCHPFIILGVRTAQPPCRPRFRKRTASTGPPRPAFAPGGTPGPTVRYGPPCPAQG